MTHPLREIFWHSFVRGLASPGPQNQKDGPSVPPGDSPNRHVQKARQKSRFRTNFLSGRTQKKMVRPYQKVGTEGPPRGRIQVQIRVKPPPSWGGTPPSGGVPPRGGTPPSGGGTPPSWGGTPPWGGSHTDLTRICTRFWTLFLTNFDEFLRFFYDFSKKNEKIVKNRKNSSKFVKKRVQNRPLGGALGKMVKNLRKNTISNDPTPPTFLRNPPRSPGVSEEVGGVGSVFSRFCTIFDPSARGVPTIKPNREYTYLDSRFGLIVGTPLLARGHPRAPRGERLDCPKLTVLDSSNPIVLGDGGLIRTSISNEVAPSECKKIGAHSLGASA